MALIAPTYEIHLTVRHDPPPAGLQVRSHAYTQTLSNTRHGNTVGRGEDVMCEKLTDTPEGYTQTSN